MLDNLPRQLLPDWFLGDRLSPPPRLPGERRFHQPLDLQTTDRQKRRWRVKVWCRCREALNNITWLLNHSFAEHQALADKGLPKADDPGWRQGPLIELSGQRASVVVGAKDGSVGLLYIPALLHGLSLVNFTQATIDHMPYNIAVHKPALWKVRTRNLGDVHRYDLGILGDCHYGLWHPQGHQYSDLYNATTDTLRHKTNEQWTSRMQFFKATESVDDRIDYLIELLRPELAAALKQARKLVLQHPGVLPLDPVWCTRFLGRAVIVNRQTGEHLDRMGVRRAWDVIVAGGDFNGGGFFFRNMKVRCPFRLGDMVAFDGTAQQHSIEGFTGTLRVSHVYYIHQSVLTELGIDERMPDVYLSNLVSRLARFERQAPLMSCALPPRFQKRRYPEESTTDSLSLTNDTQFAEKIRHVRDPKKQMALVWAHCKGKMICEANETKDEEGAGAAPAKVGHGGCGHIQPLIRKEGLKLFLFYKKGRVDDDEPDGRTSQPEKRLYPTSDVYNTLKKIPDSDLALLGLSEEFACPDWMILTVLPVPPPPVQPSISADGRTVRSEDDLTYKLGNILKALINVRRCEEEGSPAHVISEFEQLLQFHVTTYMDNDIAGIPQALQKSGRPVKAIRARLKGKEGHLRGMMGKRVDFSVRTVITGDPNLMLDQVGVPRSIAMNLTYPERVSPYNIEWLQMLCIDLQYNKRADTSLQYGWIVKRHLKDGDYVLFNHQPSLHKMSMISHRVKIMYFSTFRLNLSVTPPYNTYFDGDKMNIHILQSKGTGAKLSQNAWVPSR
ncbi:DNA-directed RNA polymerase II subunit rpb1 [Ceratobasidium sp. 392]|nr:DNA-directed RNA polymerase II subunit rpb1 [Ceratobasidium sp. 392]